MVVLSIFSNIIQHSHLFQQIFIQDWCRTRRASFAVPGRLQHRFLNIGRSGMPFTWIFRWALVILVWFGRAEQAEHHLLKKTNDAGTVPTMILLKLRNFEGPNKWRVRLIDLWLLWFLFDFCDCEGGMTLYPSLNSLSLLVCRANFTPILILLSCCLGANYDKPFLNLGQDSIGKIMAEIVAKIVLTDTGYQGFRCGQVWSFVIRGACISGVQGWRVIRH